MKTMLSCIFLTILLSACQKEFLDPQEGPKEGPPAVDKTKIYSKWNLVSYNRNGMIVTNADPCYADNWIEFRRDGKGTISQGTCIDNPPIHETQEFVWSYKDSVNIDFGDNEIRLTTLNDSALVFIVVATNSGPVNYPFQFSFKK